MLGRESPAGLNLGFGDKGDGLAARNSGEDTMAQDNRFDPARLERIERRLQLLEDAEAIGHTHARRRVSVQAIVGAADDVAYSLPSRSWIRPARR
jgi:hypothetical protein